VVLKEGAIYKKNNYVFKNFDKAGAVYLLRSLKQ